MLILSVFLFLLACFQIIAVTGVRHDDAFVSFRYGQNLATGNGLVFNPGEKIMGSTSPGQTLLSGLVYAIAGKPLLPDVMNWIGALAWMLQAVALFVFLYRFIGFYSASLISLVIGAGASGAGMWVCLETNTVVAFVLWGIVFVAFKRPYAAAVSLALAVLMRPDAMVPAMLIATWGLIFHRRHVVGPLIVFACILAIWVLFAFFWFGTVVPQSAVTKYHHAATVPYAMHIATFLPKHVFSSTHPAPVSIAWVLWAVGSIALIKQYRLLAVFPLWMALHCIAYLWMRPMVMHIWHLYPAVILFVVITFVGITSVAEQLKKRIPGRAVKSTLCVVVTAGILGLISLHLKQSIDFCTTQSEQFWTGQRHTVYKNVGEYLKKEANPGDRVAMGEVGTVAFFSELKMHDLGGLVTRSPRRFSADVRWVVHVSQQIQGWERPDFEPPYRVRYSNATLMFRAQSGRFAAWVFRF